jgi:FkbM family methyltransferase
VYGRYLHWSWSQRLGKKRLLTEFIDPLHLVVKPTFPTSVKDYIFGLRAFSEMGFLMHFLRKNDFFVDIGANIGTYSLLAAGVSESFVLSFEPDNERREFLKELVDINGLNPLIFVDPRVVSTKEETLIFSEQSVSKNIYVEAGVPRSAVSIDSLELEQIPIMIKIDAKGFALEVIQGMRGMLDEDNLRVVLCSFCDSIEPELKDLIREIILSKGFKICTYDPLKRSLKEHSELDQQLMLFVRDSEFVEQRLKQAKSFSWFKKKI